jgi:Domain of unknown function (DUF1963)
MPFRSFLGWVRGEQPQPAAPQPPPTPPPPPPPPPPADPAEVDALRARLRRRAIRMEIGGFRPPEGPYGSWFGRVNLALPGEGWPMHDGRPLHALAQIDLTQLPFRPPHLDDLELITVFIDEPPDDDQPNGEGWCLRAYPDRAKLVPLERVDTGSEIAAFPMRPQIVEEDFPGWEDLPADVPGDLYDREALQTAEGFKLGGWPFLVQGEVTWGPAFTEHPAAPAYVFQIDSTEKGGWMWGDSGVGYVGRGTRPGHTDEWTLSWQCY